MPRCVAKLDRESSMLAMVRSGIGLSLRLRLCRGSVALQEKHRHGLAINERVSIDGTLSFICLESRQREATIACALDVLDLVWGASAQNDAVELPPQRSASSAASKRP